MADSLIAKANTGAGTDKLAGKIVDTDKFAGGAVLFVGTDEVSDSNRLPVGGGALGATDESAPGTDTAASGLNGRLQRIAQRLASLIALLPASLGSKTSANSLPVVIASDQGGVPVTGPVAHDGAASGNPVQMAGYASAAAPSAVSADGDVVRAWLLRNGSQVASLAAAGALIPGDATNGLDVDVTRLPALVASSAIIGRVGIDQTTPGTTNLVALAANQTVNNAQWGGTASAGGSGAATAGSPRVILSTDSPGVTPLVQVTASYTRPGDTSIYAIGDAYANSTSAPTAGGLTFTNAAKASGKGGLIKKLQVVDSNGPGTPIQGELWLFRSAPTAINDNAAFALSDADALLVEAIIPFTTEVKAANNSIACIPLEEAFVCSGSANLRGLVRLLNAYTPANAETLSFSLDILQTD